MTKKFTHETEDGRTLNVQIVLDCRDFDGADATYDIEWIGDTQDNEVKLESLSPVDQTHIEQHAQDITDENGSDVARERWAARCEDAYDESRGH